MNKIRKIDPIHPHEEIIREAGEMIQQGGMVVFPTQCLYGLGVNALDADAIDSIFQIKGRSPHKPILVLIHDRKELEHLVRCVPPAGLRLMERFWSGNVTILFQAKETLPANLTSGTGKIGVRLCQHPVAFALAKAAESPITGTSANLSGNAGCSQISDLDPEIISNADLILDAGSLKGGIGSTIVDVTTDPPVILREGIIPAKDIFSALKSYRF